VHTVVLLYTAIQCRILRFTCLVVKIIGQCNDICGYWGFGAGTMLVSSNSLERIEWSSRTFIPIYQAICFPNQNTHWITTTVRTLNPVGQRINNWSVDQNVILGKQNCRKLVCFLETVFNNTLSSAFHNNQTHQCKSTF
jgi:hypothetical protein